MTVSRASKSEIGGGIIGARPERILRGGSCADEGISLLPGARCTELDSARQSYCYDWNPMKGQTLERWHELCEQTQ